MILLIMIITFIGLAFVILGFLEIKIPFVSKHKQKPVPFVKEVPVKSLPGLVSQAD